jgi:hypothetical protein
MGVGQTASTRLEKVLGEHCFTSWKEKQNLIQQNEKVS